MGLFTKKKSAAQALAKVKEDLQRALGDDLVCLLVFGSYASGEYQPGRSNLNLFLMIQDSNDRTLSQMEPVFRDWTRQGQPVPVIIEAAELSVYARSLPIEFLDMRDHHRVLLGEDPFTHTTVDLSNLRAQCEQELSIKLLKLRQATTLLSKQPKKLENVLHASLPSVLTLLRSVLRLTDPTPGLKKLEAAERLAKLVPFDAQPLQKLSAPLAGRYLDIIEQVYAYLGRI